MLYDLIKKCRGKETVVMTDQFRKVNDQMKKLRDCQRKGIKGQRVEYLVRPAPETNEKFKQKPHNLNLSGGPRLPGPPRIRR